MTREEAARRLREKAEDQYYVPRLRELYLMAAEALEEEPRPKGRWIDFSEPDTPAWDRVYRCSNCGKIVVYHNFVFCPECGAKMEETVYQDG